MKGLAKHERRALEVAGDDAFEFDLGNPEGDDLMSTFDVLRERGLVSVRREGEDVVVYPTDLGLLALRVCTAE